MGVPHAFPVHIPPYPQISPQQSKVFKPYQAPSTLINHPPFLSGVGGTTRASAGPPPRPPPRRRPPSCRARHVPPAGLRRASCPPRTSSASAASSTTGWSFRTAWPPRDWPCRRTARPSASRSPPAGTVSRGPSRREPPRGGRSWPPARCTCRTGSSVRTSRAAPYVEASASSESRYARPSEQMARSSFRPFSIATFMGLAHCAGTWRLFCLPSSR